MCVLYYLSFVVSLVDIAISTWAAAFANLHTKIYRCWFILSNYVIVKAERRLDRLFLSRRKVFFAISHFNPIRMIEKLHSNIYPATLESGLVCLLKYTYIRITHSMHDARFSVRHNIECIYCNPRFIVDRYWPIGQAGTHILSYRLYIAFVATVYFAIIVESPNAVLNSSRTLA